MWAAGIIMYEIVTGQHPFYVKGQTKEVVMEKLSIIKDFSYPKEMSKEAKHLISMLCTREMAQRFKAKAALTHPWITRELNGQLPLTFFQQQTVKAKDFEIEQKLRKAVSSILFITIVKIKNAESK